MLAKSTFVDAFSIVRYKWTHSHYVRLLIYIVVTSLLLYWKFIFGDKVFAFLIL